MRLFWLTIHSGATSLQPTQQRPGLRCTPKKLTAYVNNNKHTILHLLNFLLIPSKNYIYYRKSVRHKTHTMSACSRQSLRTRKRISFMFFWTMCCMVHAPKSSESAKQKTNKTNITYCSIVINVHVFFFNLIIIRIAPCLHQKEESAGISESLSIMTFLPLDL